MNERASLAYDGHRPDEPTFVSYATADRKKALAVCEALEKRGTSCWISCRDVEPGENYQEAIVRHVRKARAMVLVFSDAANNSDEIKKELSLASRYRVPVLALRIEDVEPSDAFAYELSTRQWIDAFAGWDRSLDALVRKIERLSNVEQGRHESARTRSERLPRRFRLSKIAVAAISFVALLSVAAAGWILVRTKTAMAHSMVVRLSGFERLSADVPAGMPGALRDEIIAAFTEDGVINVSTAVAAPAGSQPAFTLSGTVRRDGDQVRVIARLVNDRSGTTLWSNGFNYASSETGRIPRWVAVDVGSVLRCGLFGASTYRKQLPDPVLSDYLQACQSTSTADFVPTRSLDFARKVVAAAPDFSWGWSGVAGAAVASIGGLPTNTRVTDARIIALRKEALAAADRAIALDPSNSEAFVAKSTLVDGNDVIGREALLKKALAARRLACGCEHHFYGILLQEVGRNRDAIEEFHRSIDVMALDPNSHAALGVALLVEGEVKEAEAQFDAALDLDTSGSGRNSVIRLFTTVAQRGYALALQSLDATDVGLPEETIAAYRLGFRALVNGSPSDRANAIKALSSLPPPRMGGTGILLLASLGANKEALKIIEAGTATGTRPWRAYLFYPPLAGARRDPSFPALTVRLGLMRYWKMTHSKPDVCSANDAPPFCRMI